MTTIAFIGLGIMGGPMAANLVKAGHDGDRLQPQPGQGRRPGRRRRPRAPTASPRPSATPTWSSRWCPTPPTSRRCRAATDGMFATARPGTLHVDMSTIRPDVAVRRRRGGRRAGLRVLDAPVSGGEAGAIEASLSIMVGGEPRRLRGRAAGAGGRRQDDRARRPRRRRARPSRPRTSSSSPATSSSSPRRSCSSRPTASTPRPRWRCSPAAWPAAPCSTARPRTCSTASSSRASGSTCTTRTSASSRRPPARQGVAIPLGAVVAQLVGALRAHGHGGLDHSGLLKLRRSVETAVRPRHRHDRRTDMARMTAADAAVADPGARGRHARLRRARARRSTRSTPRCAAHGGDRARARPARRGRLAHGRGLHPRPRRQHRRLRRHLRPRGHRHDHRPVLGVGRLDPDPVHHRPGAGRPAAQGGLPGRRHRRRSPRR